MATDPPRKRGSRARSWLARHPRSIPAAVFLAICAITALSVFAIESNARDRQRAEVRDYARTVASALDRRGNSVSSYLRAGAALFSTIDTVDAQTFRQFVAELRLDQGYRGSEGIGWIEAVDPEDAGEFLLRMRADRPAFPAIRPPASPGREMLTPVTYYSPDSLRNRRALGFDMYSDPVRASAIDEAKRTVRPTASGRIVLAQERSGQAPGFAIFMPAYATDPQSPTRGRKLAGFVFSSFNAEQFLDAAIQRSAPTQLGVRLYDGEPEAENLLVSRSLGEEGSDRFEVPVTIANRDFLLVIDSPDAGTLDVLSTVTLAFGLSIASMLMLILRLVAKQAVVDQDRLAFYEEQNSIRNSLSRELNHRVKNTLANVLSIMSLTRRRATDLDDFADSLQGRVQALSATHDLLTGSDWGTTPINSVLEAELSHFVGTDGEAIVTEGPPVELAPNDALSFGLAIHELATNAAKYGALSVAGGKVRITWHLVSDTLAHVEWSETEGPAVAQKRRRGFGVELIEKIVAHELKHPVQLEFRPEGVHCVLGVPVRRPSEFQMRQRLPDADA